MYCKCLFFSHSHKSQNWQHECHLMNCVIYFQFWNMPYASMLLAIVVPIYNISADRNMWLCVIDGKWVCFGRELALGLAQDSEISSNVQHGVLEWIQLKKSKCAYACVQVPPNSQGCCWRFLGCFPCFVIIFILSAIHVIKWW